jgi:hypothetical protein
VSEKYHRVAIFILIGLLSLISCSNTEKAILGKWESGAESMEFFKDGTVSVVSGGMSLGGTYKFVDDERVKIDLSGFGALAGPLVLKVKVSRNNLTVTNSKGNVSTYQRVDP